MSLFPAEITPQERSALSRCIAYLPLVEPDQAYADRNNPTRGKCYAASIALFVYLGGRDAGYALMRGSDSAGVHYWVENRFGKVLDPTAEQFAVMRRQPPYFIGKSVGFRPNVKRHLPILNAMQKEDAG